MIFTFCFELNLMDNYIISKLNIIYSLKYIYKYTLKISVPWPPCYGCWRSTSHPAPVRPGTRTLQLTLMVLSEGKNNKSFAKGNQVLFRRGNTHCNISWKSLTNQKMSITFLSLNQWTQFWKRNPSSKNV